MGASHDGLRYLRAVLAEESAATESEGLGDEDVIDALAARIAQGKLTLVTLRPEEAPVPPLQGDEAPAGPPEAVEPPNEVKEPDEWLEITLVDDVGQPMAGAAYRVELENGAVLEGYLDDSGKKRFEGISKGSAKVIFPELEEEDWRPS
jgi:hypothetical protein